MPQVCPRLPFVGRSSSSYTLRIEHTRRPNIRKSSGKSSFVVRPTSRLTPKTFGPIGHVIFRYLVSTRSSSYPKLFCPYLVGIGTTFTNSDRKLRVC